MRHDNSGHDGGGTHHHGHSTAPHDPHIRAEGDHPGKSHLHNAMGHLHRETRAVDSLALSGHESHVGEPKPKDPVVDHPGV